MDQKMLLLCLLITAASAAVSCPSFKGVGGCNTDLDCKNCGDSSIVNHTLFTQPVHLPFIQYLCSDFGCRLNTTLAQQSTNLVTICNSISSGPCCMPLFVNPLDLRGSASFVGTGSETTVCQSKKCNVPADCNDFGRCIYEETSAYDDCCTVSADCPPLVFDNNDNDGDHHPRLTDYNVGCGRFECNNNDCVLDHDPQCCVAKANCSVTLGAAPFTSADYSCLVDPTTPAAGKCYLGFATTPTNACETDFDCGSAGLANQCAMGECHAGECQISPHDVGSQAGCCLDSSDDGVATCQTSDACLDFLSCDYEIHSINPFDDDLTTLNYEPTFRCLYKDYRSSGCCTSNLDCQAADDVAKCVSSTCNLATNLCNLRANFTMSTGPLTCAHFSGDCGIPDPSNMCSVYLVQHNVDETAVVPNLFKCELATIVDCVPNNPPPMDGLVPTIISTTVVDECAWTCHDADRNTVRIKVDFQNLNIDFSLRPLYEFDVRINTTNNLASTRVVNDITFVSAEFTHSDPFYAHLQRPVPTGTFTTRPTLDLSVSGNSLSRTFHTSPVQFPLIFGETIQLFFDIQFNATTSLTDIAIFASILKFEPCVEYYLNQNGADGCTTSTDIENGVRIARGADSSSSVNAAFGSSCSDQCFGSIPTTTATTAVTPKPTPKPTPSPPFVPTPVPITVPTPAPGVLPPAPPVIQTLTPLNGLSLFNDLATLDLSLLDCSWQCGDPLDGTINRILLRYRETCVDCPVRQPFILFIFGVKGTLDSTDVDVNVALDFSDNNHLPPFIEDAAFSTAMSPGTIGGIRRTEIRNITDTDPLQLYLSLHFAGDVIQQFDTISFSLQIQQDNYLCDSASVTAGYCLLSQLSQVVIGSFIFPVVIPWPENHCSVPCAPDPDIQQSTAIVATSAATCEWDCSDNTANTMRVAQCANFSLIDNPLTDGQSALPIQLVGLEVMSPTGTLFPFGGRKLYFDDQIYSALFAVSVDPTRDRTYFRFPGDVGVVLQFGDVACWTVSYQLGQAGLDDVTDVTISSFVVGEQRCTWQDAIAGVCPVFRRSNTISISDGVNDNVLVALNLHNDTGGKVFLKDFIASAANQSFTLLSEQCSEQCVFLNIPDGFIGGLVFFDSDGDGTFQLSSDDEPFSGIRVSAYTTGSSLASSLVATVTTDSSGVYKFNRSALFAVADNPMDLNVFFRAAIPAGTNVVTRIGASGNEYFDNVFVADTVAIGSARTFASFGVTSPTVVAQSFGFQDRSTSCTPETGPSTGSNQLILRESIELCDACATEPQADQCEELCAKFDGTTYRRVQVRYTLDNSESDIDVPASSVTAELASIGGPVRCLEPSNVSKDARLRILQIRRPNQRPPFNIGARASYAYPTIVGGDTMEFVVQWSVCFEAGSSPLIDTTATIFTDRCVKEVRDWRSCTDTTIDPSDCYQELAADLSECQTECITDAPAPLPPRNSTLEVLPFLTREPVLCVSHRRIDSFLCRDKTASYDACQTSATNRTVVVGHAIVRQPSTETADSERGALRVTLQRDMSIASLKPCRNVYDPQMQLIVRNAALEIENNDHWAKVLRSDVDHTNTEATIIITFLPLSPGESIEVIMRELECNGAAPLTYNITAQLITELCFGGIECTEHTAYNGSVSGLTTEDECLPLSELPTLPFVRQDTPGVHAVIAFEHVQLESPDASTFWTFIGVSSGLLGVVALTVAAYSIRRNRRAKRKSAVKL